jgi:hypothetical protein
LLHEKHAWVFIPLPLSALLFLVYCLLWLLNDSFWIPQGKGTTGPPVSVRSSSHQLPVDRVDS